jgi:hypothetical protein
MAGGGEPAGQALVNAAKPARGEVPSVSSTDQVTTFCRSAPAARRQAATLSSAAAVCSARPGPASDPVASMPFCPPTKIRSAPARTRTA